LNVDSTPKTFYNPETKLTTHLGQVGEPDVEPLQNDYSSGDTYAFL
jgi:hypothetical protein